MNATSTGSRALAQRTSVAVAARDAFDPRQVGLLEALAPGAPSPVFNQFLEACVRYELDPFMGQIWLAQMGGRDGSGGGWVVMVGRDGLLTVANRSRDDDGVKDFEGIEGDVVYSNDKFSKRNMKNGPQVTHEVTNVADRGEMVGAWALCHRRGRKSSYFFAQYKQYLPRSQAKRDKSPWAQYDDAMILKCAQSVALRLAFSITGLVVAEEVIERITPGTTTDRGEGVAGQLDWGEDELVKARLVSLFAKVNEMEPGKWLPRKIELALRGKGDAERVRLADELEEWITERGGEVPTILDPVLEGEDITEGEFEPVDNGDERDDLDDGSGMQVD